MVCNLSDFTVGTASIFYKLKFWGVLFVFPWLLLLWSTGSRYSGSVVVAHRFSCFTACRIFLDQGLNL